MNTALGGAGVILVSATGFPDDVRCKASFASSHSDIQTP